MSLRFRRRFQQLTGPVMAKSLEDTLFYRYARLLALNEVGGDPGDFGARRRRISTRANAARARDWPNAMIATATHDTKRGEDARARLLALSEMPGGLGARPGTPGAKLAGAASRRDRRTSRRPDANDQ